MAMRQEDIFTRLRRYFPEEAAQELSTIIGDVSEAIKQVGVSREDFNELKDIVKELAGAQKKTGEQVEQLAFAQRRTEEKVEQLAESVEQLAEAQRRTEEKVEQLAEAQRRTEEEVRTLTKAVKGVQKQVGGISHSVGFNLENEAYKALPRLLKSNFDLEIRDKLLRRFIEYPWGGDEEVNIFGKGTKNGKELTIIGEAKVQLSRADIDRFLKKVGRLARLIEGEKILLMITHLARPEVIKYASEKEIKIYHSYEF